MGNIFQGFFSSSSKNKRNSHRVSSISSTGSKKSKASVDLNLSTDVKGQVVPEKQSEKISSTDPNNVKPASPFKRDFCPPPEHELLVPLEKYRPRRSNVRRSARVSRIQIKDNQKQQLNHTENETADNHFDKPKEDKSPSESPTYYEDVATFEIIQKENAQNESEEKNIKEEMIDEMDPSERTKVVRTKISDILRRQQQNPTRSVMVQDHHLRKYQSVIEPTPDYYEQSSPPWNQNSELKHQTSIDLDNENKVGDEHHQQQENNQENVLENNNSNNSVFRRPKKPHLIQHGNALLIDELKKRQSHFYESTSSRDHYPNHHPHLIQKCASIEST